MNPLHMMGLYSVFNLIPLPVWIYKVILNHLQRKAVISYCGHDPLRSHAGTNLCLGTFSGSHIGRTEDENCTRGKA